jgi:hypothetical protein
LKCEHQQTAKASRKDAMIYAESQRRREIICCILKLGKPLCVFALAFRLCLRPFAAQQLLFSLKLFVIFSMRIIVSTILLLSQLCTYANRIDSLKNDNEVLDFLRTVSDVFVDKAWGTINIPMRDSVVKNYNCNGYFEEWKCPVWQKVDLNRDNRTDMIVTVHQQSASNYVIVAAYTSYVIIDNGDNNYQVLNLNNSLFTGCSTLSPLLLDQEQLLLLYHKKYQSNKHIKSFGDIKNYWEVDTLVYRFGSFVEWNEHPKEQNIGSIFMKTWGCYGSCPIFSISIDKKGRGVYDAIRYNEEDHGILRADINKNKLGELKELINYIDWEKLTDYYGVPWTDDVGCSIKIRFMEGPSIEIEDYGMGGSFALSRLYHLLSDLKDSEDWRY